MPEYINILRIAELAACIAGFVFYKKYNHTAYRQFSYYLLFIVLAEFAGRYFEYFNYQTANKVLYTYLVIPIEFLFFFWLFNRTFVNVKDKRLPLASGIIYIACWLVDILFLKDKLLWFFYSFSYTIGNLFLLVLIFRYYMRLITTDAILNFRQDMMFWISGGLLLFYLGTFPFYGLLNVLTKRYIQLTIAYSYVVVTLNCLMYLMFTLGFIWSNPNSKSSSS